ESHQFDVATVNNTVAIQQFAAQSGVQILVPAKELEGKTLHAVSGHLSTDAALSTLLEGTGLTHRYVGERTVALVKEGQPVSDAADASQADSAQTTAERGVVQIEEVVVTAQK